MKSRGNKERRPSRTFAPSRKASRLPLAKKRSSNKWYSHLCNRNSSSSSLPASSRRRRAAPEIHPSSNNNRNSMILRSCRRSKKRALLSHHRRLAHKRQRFRPWLPFMASSSHRSRYHRIWNSIPTPINLCNRCSRQCSRLCKRCTKHHLFQSLRCRSCRCRRRSQLLLHSGRTSDTQ